MDCHAALSMSIGLADTEESTKIKPVEAQRPPNVTPQVVHLLVYSPVVMLAVALAFVAFANGLRNPGRGRAPRTAFTPSRSLRMQSDVNVDVAVIGGGIAGTTISWLLQEREGLQVALIDPKVNVPGAWYPNYGEWRDEWHALSERLKLPELKECTTTEWEWTDCFFGGSFDVPMEKRTTLQRPYVRVDRVKMQALLRGRFDKAN